MSLLLGERAFGIGAVLTGSLAAALLTAVVLRLRSRTCRRIHDAEAADRRRDHIPDVCQTTNQFNSRVPALVLPGRLPDVDRPDQSCRQRAAGSGLSVCVPRVSIPPAMAVVDRHLPPSGDALEGWPTYRTIGQL